MKIQSVEPTEPAFFKQRGIATFIGVSPRMVDKLRRQGMPHVRLSKRCVLYPKQAVLDWMAARTVGTK
jgi:hypothetical protein